MNTPQTLTIIVALFMVSCVDLNVNDPNEECRDRIAEPIFLIEGVVSSATFEKIATVRIQNVIINDNPVPADSVMNDFPENLEVQNGTLICTTPCGFGTAPGVYQMQISSPGYETLSITEEADYLVQRTGCLALRTGGHRISLQLKPD